MTTEQSLSVSIDYKLTRDYNDRGGYIGRRVGLKYQVNGLGIAIDHKFEATGESIEAAKADGNKLMLAFAKRLKQAYLGTLIVPSSITICGKDDVFTSTVDFRWDDERTTKTFTVPAPGASSLDGARDAASHLLSRFFDMMVEYFS